MSFLHFSPSELTKQLRLKEWLEHIVHHSDQIETVQRFGTLFSEQSHPHQMDQHRYELLQVYIRQLTQVLGGHKHLSKHLDSLLHTENGKSLHDDSKALNLLFLVLLLSVHHQ